MLYDHMEWNLTIEHYEMIIYHLKLLITGRMHSNMCMSVPGTRCKEGTECPPMQVCVLHTKSYMISYAIYDIISKLKTMISNIG